MPRWTGWLKPRHLPFAIGAALLAISWVLVWWNLTVAQLAPRLTILPRMTILGVVADPRPPWSLHAAAFQHWASRAIGRLSPVFRPAVKWKNQIYYTLLGMAGSDRVMVGTNRQLLEDAYLTEYCSRDLAQVRERGEAWAPRIRTLQDFFEARGKFFLYVITPSKVAQYPAIMPSGYVCPSSEKDRTQNLTLYDSILTRNGVHFVDTASYLAGERSDYAIDLFPRGGIHWNWLGAALAARKLTDTVNRLSGEPILTPFDFTWRVADTPTGSDRDLLDLMNLSFPDDHYPVPEVTFHAAAPASGCRSTAMTEVGGSFLMKIDRVLRKIACPPDITYWFYWDTKQFRFEGERRVEQTADPQERRRSLLDADVILLEENEVSAPGSRAGQLLMQEVAALSASAAALATRPAELSTQTQQ